MAIRKTTVSARPAARRTSISAGSSIAANAVRKNAKNVSVLANSRMKDLTPEQARFCRQLQSNSRKLSAVTAATNTNNIMARPDFLELLPLFVQKLVAADVFGSVAMNSRQQLIPYFKFVAENTKGETQKGTILSSPFVNRQGMDANFTGRLVKKEAVAGSTLAYVPVLPGSITLAVTAAGGAVTQLSDDGNGNLVNAGGTTAGTINYATGVITGVTGTVSATYQYDNETVGPDAQGNYGAKMAKGYLQLDEINLVAEAHEIACYWSLFSAFAATKEYGANIGDQAKEAAVAELTAEINTICFGKLAESASYNPQFNWDASPVLSSAVVPSDYLNMFKLKLQQAASAIYQATRLAHANRLVVGTNVAAFLAMIDGYQAEGETDVVGPYKAGKLDNFEIFVDPNYDVNTWVMCCKSNDIRRNTALFGEYMPVTSTDAIGLANMSIQQGAATMYAAQVVNPYTAVSGKILGTF